MLPALAARRHSLYPWQLSASFQATLRWAHGSAQRGEHYGRVTSEDISQFKRLLGENGVVTDEHALQTYNRDWMGKYMGRSTVALKPRTTQQVSEILKYCNSKRLPVVPQGGNTGLVGGSVPVFDEVVLSTAAMNQIISFDQVSGTLVAQAGCVLQTLDEHVAKSGFMMPLDLGAKGSCHIGGNVSTNAGGLRLLRYGSLHGSVLGVEVVLADGTVLDLLKTLRKDNTGYHLKNLFVGAEGTLGIVTAVSVQCAPKPASVQLAFLTCPSYEHVTRTLQLARRKLAEVLSAFEFLDAECMAMATTYLPGVINPLAATAGNSSSAAPAAVKGDGGGAAAGQHGCGASAPFYMLVETHGSHAGHDQEKLEAFLEESMASGCVSDGVVSASEAQSTAIWRVREGITESLVHRGAVYKYDVSLPVARLYELVEDMRQRLAGWPGVRVVGYGHVGDGNLHLNISAPKYDDALLARIEPFVYEWTTRVKGSISAEHGLGAMKASVIGYSQAPEAVQVMSRIKQLLDPHALLNPYKVLPPDAASATQSTG